MEGARSAFNFLTGKLAERDSLESLGTDGRTILEWILKK